MRREKASLPVDVCGSKTFLLKFPIGLPVTATSNQEMRSNTLFMSKKDKMADGTPRCPIPYPIPQVRSSYSLKPVKSVFLIYTSQNNKPLHHTVSSPMNRNYGGLVKYKTRLDNTILG